MSFASPDASKKVSSDFKTLPDGLTKFICKFNLLAILVASSVPQRMHSFFYLIWLWWQNILYLKALLLYSNKEHHP